jgi:hypothetical protein
MNTTACTQKNIISGVIAGVIGGIANGFMMIKMHQLNNIGAIIGMPYPLSGFLFHLFCSAVLGFLFALLFYKLTQTFFSTIVWGVVYGFIWWVIAYLTIAPMMMGQSIDWSMSAMAHGCHMLMSHLVFGLTMAAAYYRLRNSES